MAETARAAPPGHRDGGNGVGATSVRGHHCRRRRFRRVPVPSNANCVAEQSSGRAVDPGSETTVLSVPPGAPGEQRSRRGIRAAGPPLRRERPAVLWPSLTAPPIPAGSAAGAACQTCGAWPRTLFAVLPNSCAACAATPVIAAAGNQR